MNFALLLSFEVLWKGKVCAVLFALLGLLMFTVSDAVYFLCWDFSCMVVGGQVQHKFLILLLCLQLSSLWDRSMRLFLQFD